MVICIIRIHKKGNKREEAHSSRKKGDMHIHIEVNTVQSVCVNKREKNERVSEKEKERRERRDSREKNYDCCCSYRRIHIRERDIIHIYRLNNFVVTTFIDMKFGLLLFLLFILSIISSITTDGLFQSSSNKDGAFQKLRQKVSNSKYKRISFSYLFRYTYIFQ
jgi:hypothetical protein